MPQGKNYRVGLWQHITHLAAGVRFDRSCPYCTMTTSTGRFHGPDSEAVSADIEWYNRANKTGLRRVDIADDDKI